MLVDSFRFLPRSFAAMYESVEPLPDEREPVWAAFEPRLADARIALLTSAGLYKRGDQETFDLERERREPGWGDPSHRVLPDGIATVDVGMAHLHVNNDDVLDDHNVALPTDVLAGLVNDGVVGSSTDRHLSVMGYQQAGLDVWRTETAPALIEVLRDERADGIVLAPV